MFLYKNQLHKKPRPPPMFQKLKALNAQVEILGLCPKDISGSTPTAPELRSSGRNPTMPGDRILEQDAVVVLNNMANPENALLALKKGKDLDRAEKLFDELLERGVQPDNVTFSTMISCVRMSSLPDKAVEWFKKMPSFGCNPDDVTYSAMIDAYGHSGKVDMAFSLYDRARTSKWRIDPVTFSTLIKIHGQSLNFDGCLNVYEEMKVIGAKPNLVIYNTLLDAMGRAKRPW
ncbi:unnamed protein product [Prunus armeniaca]